MVAFMAKLEFVRGKSAVSPRGAGWGKVGKRVSVSERTPNAVGGQVKNRKIVNSNLYANSWLTSSLSADQLHDLISDQAVEHMQLIARSLTVVIDVTDDLSRGIDQSNVARV